MADRCNQNENPNLRYTANINAPRYWIRCVTENGENVWECIVTKIGTVAPTICSIAGPHARKGFEALDGGSLCPRVPRGV